MSLETANITSRGDLDLRLAITKRLFKKRMQNFLFFFLFAFFSFLILLHFPSFSSFFFLLAPESDGSEEAINNMTE